MEVIDTMKNGGQSAGAAAAVFDDCYFLACDFPLTRFEHCNREANKVVHKLGKLAKKCDKGLVQGPMDEKFNVLTKNQSESYPLMVHRHHISK